MLVQGIEQVDTAIAEMRRLIADLRPTTLDELGLGPALEALGERVELGTELRIRMNLDLDLEGGRTDSRLEVEIEDTVYRLVQEALNNVVQHANADSVRIDVSEDGEQVRVRVRDEGDGFDPTARSDGFGLVGMRERVSLAGGTLELNSVPGKGTTITAVLPATHRKSDEPTLESRRSKTA
jgi:signal transduction histidine kinase